MAHSHVLVIGLAIMVSTAHAEPGSTPSALMKEIEDASFDATRAVDAGGLTIDIGLISMQIESGMLFPVDPVEGAVREMVFLGEATIELDPPNEIEAGQLKFHTGSPGLSEPVDEATLVICRDDAVEAILRGRAPAMPDATATARASELLAEWRESREREVVGANAGILLDILGDAPYDDYFAGRFSGRRLGSFLVLVDPDAAEQVSVGQFVLRDLTDSERRRTERAIRRQQRKGRLSGLTLDDLGTFDHWMMTPLANGSGRASPGLPPFEATHYEMEVSIDRGGEKISGTATIDIAPRGSERRIVRFAMDRDLSLIAVMDGEGQPIPFVQELGTAYAVLPEAPNGPTSIRVEFEGTMIQKVEGTLYALMNTQRWYPHVGEHERATYDVTLDWPQHYDVVAAGRHVDGEQRGDTYWERRAIDVPVSFFSFEVGRFDFREETFGDVRARFAFDRRTNVPEHIQQSVVDTTGDALEFFEDAFGPYPLDHLTVVTAPRSFGQGLLSFVSLPSFLMYEQAPWFRALGFEDPRMVIAHELAHQWWGNMLGWKGYRDQWLSEAMASHAARRWAMHLPEASRPRVVWLNRWQQDLESLTGANRIEEIGPIVLGHRLDSSKVEAMQPIVYEKGAVVLGMLEQILGTEPFYETQKSILEVANYREISTETYIAALERLTGVDLAWFAERYIYGTTVPRVLYRYDVVRDEDGERWRVEVATRTVPGYFFDYRVEELADGRFDVRRTVRRVGDPQSSALAVPFQIPVVRDDVEPRLLKKKNMRRFEDRFYNAVVKGRMFLEGEESGAELTVDYEPVGFWLDRDHVVLGLFFHENQAPKVLRLHEAYAAEAAGKTRRAISVLDELALEIEQPADAEIERPNESLTRQIDLYRARLYMDLGDLPRAREHLTTAESSEWRWFGADPAKKLRARLQILEGDYGRAFKTHRKTLTTNPWRLEGDDLLILAIAARRLEKPETSELALQFAHSKGVDVGPLDPEGGR